MATQAIVTAPCMIICLALLGSRRSALTGTTLLAPFRWSVFSLGSLLVSDLLIFFASDMPQASALRYVAATTTFCPLMAVLGAKRPQNLAWQFVVVSLWVILILPVGETLVLWRGGQLTIGAARAWFLVALLLVGLSNYVLTRYGLSALLLTAGQGALVQEHLPFSPSVAQAPLAGVALITVGILVACRHRGDSRRGWDGVWFDFRDAFGTVWALRVLDRVNATAELRDWNVRLGWYGFYQIREAAKETQQQDAELQQAVRTLLRRFVSKEWIDRRVTTCS